MIDDTSQSGIAYQYRKCANNLLQPTFAPYAFLIQQAFRNGHVQVAAVVVLSERGKGV